MGTEPPKDRIAPPYVPLVVAVTGHRNVPPEARPELWLQARNVLLELLSARGRRRLVVLTGLAEGADRIVANVAFDLKEQAAYRDVVDVVACLPLASDAYEQDFEDDASRQEFRDLCSRCVHTIVVAGEGGRTERPECYRDQGQFLARHAHVLVALWDGEGKRGGGGTAEVAAMMLGRPPADVKARLADPIAAGKVIQIVTPRADRAAPPGVFARRDHWIADGIIDDPSAPEATRARRAEAAEALFEAIDQSIRTLNVRIAAEHAAGDGRVVTSEQYLKEDSRPDAWKPIEYLVRAYGYADAFAIPDKGLWQGAHRRLTLLVAGFLTAFVLYSDQFHFPPLLIAYGVIAAIALGYWRTARNHKNRHLDSRALAEGLRVQLVWHLAGVDGAVADEYLGFQAGELDWIRSAIRSWELEARWRCTPAAPADEVLPNADVVTSQWLASQATFFTNRTEDKTATVERFRRLRVTFRWLAVAATIGLLGWSLVPPLMGSVPPSTWLFEKLDVSEVAGWMMAASLAFLMWAVLDKYVEVEAYEEEARQYVRMGALFREALGRIEELETIDAPDDVRKSAYLALLRDAGREALQENRDWLLLHRDRQLSPYA